MNKRLTATRLGRTLGALLLSIVAGACGSSPTTPTPPANTTPPVDPAPPANPAPPNPAPTLTQIQAQIFDPICTACHTDVGRSPSAGLNLKAGSAFAQLVGVASSNNPGAVRVIAGNANGSYIVQKLEGTAGIVGLRMPRNGPPFLTDAQVQLIRDWITAGALNN